MHKNHKLYTLINVFVNLQIYITKRKKPCNEKLVSTRAISCNWGFFTDGLSDFFNHFLGVSFSKLSLCHTDGYETLARARRGETSGSSGLTIGGAHETIQYPSQVIFGSWTVYV